MQDIMTRPSVANDLRLTPQAKTVLAHLLRYRHITPLKALHVYNISRLASCIHEIRKAGYRVECVMCSDPCRHRYADYALIPAVH